MSDLQAEENMAKDQAKMTDEHATVIKSSVENIRNQSLEFKMAFDAKEAEYEAETDILKDRYENINEREKELAFSKINENFNEYKVINIYSILALLKSCT